MKNILIILMTALVLSGCSNPAQSQVTTRTLKLNAFSKITLNMSADVFIRQGAVQEVSVEGDRELIDMLSTKVADGKWVIEFDRNNVRVNNNLVIHITLPYLEYAKVNGSGDIRGKGQFSADDFYIGINGSGDIHLDIDAKKLTVSINGSGDVYLSGKAGETEIKINGSGDVKSPELSCSNAVVRINGSGDVSIHVTDKLEARINGSGDVKYSGDPDIIIRKNGSGDVTRKS